MKRNISDEVRKQVFLRDRGECQEVDCVSSLANGDKINLHHLKPEQFGGMEVPSNLVALCDIHHKMMHIEFHAFYPDSQNVLKAMNRIMQATRSRLRKLLKVDDGYDLSPFLEYLTGHTHFREGQLRVIRTALSGRDVLFVTPTGSGKSVCYQLPGFIVQDPVLVVSPLKALMKDQVKNIWKKKIPATYINSDLSESEKSRRFIFIKQKMYKFIFVAPERFFKSSSSANEALYQKYGFLVIDEAHSIDLWGKAFRSSYSKIGELHTKIGSPALIALTASASKETQEVIINSLGMRNPEVIVTGFYRENIKIIKHGASIRKKNGVFTQNRLNYVTDVLANTSNEKTLIFVPTKKIGHELLQDLRARGFDVEFYFGDLDTKMKMNIQDRFTGLAKPSLSVLISTSAFGMGIDIPDIRNVIHWMPALGIEEYYQQIGRAGRDGKQSFAHLLYQQQDNELLRFLATVSLQNSGFKQEHGYSDEDVDKVRKDIELRLEQMIKLTNVPAGAEWDYILDYFGQTKPAYWERHGMLIVDTILNVMIIISLFLVLWAVVGKLFL